MRRTCPYVAVLLIYLMMPAAIEITENLVHLALTGHAAHAIDDAAHRPDDPEHGCSGPLHVCPCHASTAFTVARSTVAVGIPIPDEIEVRHSAEDTPTEGHLEDVFRPPIV